MTKLADHTRWNWKPKLRWFAAEFLVVVTGILVATGDLGLIRNDSLRSAITTYLGDLEMRRETLPLYRAVAGESYQTIRSGRDYSAEYALILAMVDFPTDHPLYPLPVGPRRRTLPLDVEAFLSDPAMESAVADKTFSSGRWPYGSRSKPS